MAGAPKEEREGERYERAGDCHPELLARRARVAAHLGDAAEEPEVDPSDAYPVAHRHHRVAELVENDREKEEQGADRGEGERLRVLSRVEVLVETGQGPDHQEQ